MSSACLAEVHCGVTDHSETREPYLEAFLSEVPDALTHLYDYAHLENHSLVRLLQLHERYLASDGFEFKGVSSAGEALKQIALVQPSVSVHDIMMRDLDGRQLLQALRMRPEVERVPMVAGLDRPLTPLGLIGPPGST